MRRFAELVAHLDEKGRCCCCRAPITNATGEVGFQIAGGEHAGRRLTFCQACARAEIQKVASSRTVH